MPNGDVIDFFWEWYRRRKPTRRSSLGELALDKCEETLLRRDWQGFGYWHAIFVRERRRMKVGRIERPRH
jgi:hypothetical protein